jgi:hypothetical protein
MPKPRKLFTGKKPKALPGGISKDRSRYKSMKGQKLLAV